MNEIINILKINNLKVTPQRIAVLNALLNLAHHPTAELIIDFIRIHHSNIATGTIYNTLETFVNKGIVKKVLTEKDSMRYDIRSDKHHHLHCRKTESIKDFEDSELTQLIENYLRQKQIPNFEIEEIQLQIMGNFNINNSIGKPIE